MDGDLKSLIQEIDRCYFLADQELLERQRLEEIELKIPKLLDEIIKKLDDEILSLKFKKLNSGWRLPLRSGPHNIQTAQSKLESWRVFINEVLAYIKTSTKTFKNRLETEDLFIESRSKEGGDLHLIIGIKDGTPDKAHVIFDEKTGEIRVEDNQKEPLELVRKIESIITLPSGKKIRATREMVEEILE